MTGRPRVGVAAPLAAAVYLIGDLALLWFGWSADEPDAAFRVAFVWWPIVGAVLAAVLLVALGRRSAALARGVGYAEFARIAVIGGALIVVGAGGASSGSHVVVLVLLTAVWTLQRSFLAFVVARRLSPGGPVRR